MNISKFQYFTPKVLRLSLLVFSFCFLTFSLASAAVPKLLTYDGLLKNSSGSFLTGTYSMTFRIYTASSGGTAQWTETQSSVSVSSGKFSVQLGSVTALNLAFTSDYWLSVQVGSDSEMTPRLRLTSAGYAVIADSATNNLTQAQHDALTHKNIEGVKDNTVNIAKTNFKLDAYSLAVANSMGDMVMDTFTDASGIHAASSSGYAWRGASDYDVTVNPGGIDSYAKLVLHANGSDTSTVFDDSSTGGTNDATAGGNAQVDTAQSKFGGASALFDGNGDYLTIPYSADWDFGTGDFTIDFWLRFNGTAGTQVIFDRNDGVIGPQIQRTSAGSLQVNMLTAGVYAENWSPSINTWYHVALTRSGTNLRIFINGTQLGVTITNSSNLTGATGLRIGSDSSGSYFNGWLDEVRISKGIARWTSNFTSPSSEYAGPSSSATVISNAYTESVAPAEALVIADETLGTGTITYHVSRNNGTNWTQCTKETNCSISAQPSGTQLKWKAVITGNAELNAVAVAV